MKFTQNNTFLMVVFATSLIIGNATGVFDHNSEIGLLRYFARSNDLLQQDPTRSLNCFNKYIPLINEVASNYETNYKACLNESEAASAKADESTLEQRNDLANAAEASCALLKQCQEDKSVNEIFQCYIDGGSANIQTMYTINSNASQELSALREQYYLIKNEEYRCTNETKRAYEKKSAEAYAGLNNCILGNADNIITEEPSTTVEPTTNSPAQTTSAEQGTTDNPITSTENETTTPESTSESPEQTNTWPATTTEESSLITDGTTSGEAETTQNSITLTTKLFPEETTSENPARSDALPEYF